jgi:hypothetical protein
MATKAVLEVAPGMQRIYRRFEHWRGSHQGRLPIPEALWAAAAELAREHGVGRTAKILRLEHGRLKRMVKSAPPAYVATCVAALAANREAAFVYTDYRGLGVAEERILLILNGVDLGALRAPARIAPARRIGPCLPARSKP